jgi:branched-subunit amino acid transport protein AzlD
MVNITGIGRFLIKWGNPTFESLVEDRIWVAINFFVVFSALVAVALIVASGYMFMTSAGDPEKIQKAQKALTAAVVGMIIVFLARTIIGFVLSLVDGNIISEILDLGLTSFFS